ncbi:MAG TPA: LapA family protein [Casimicrobiaceae bacterium]|jgi:uncharacterized integral membrane protein|nr:LapA family protein [Casimicrobiaceae bacterium]
MTFIRWIVFIGLFALLLFLSLQNADVVELKFFNLASLRAPLIFVVLTAFAAGVAAGLIAGAFKIARLKRQINRLRREHRHLGPAPHGAAPGTAPASGPGFEP